MSWFSCVTPRFELTSSSAGAASTITAGQASERSGTDRYEILRCAGFRCELCGVPADERALEVDHIVPRRHGGSDDRSNLQALCSKCNANKGARDATDFRLVRDQLGTKSPNCIFCDVGDRVVAENE